MSEDTKTAEWGPMRSFGRIKSRKLKAQQATLFDTLLPHIELTDARLTEVLASGRELWLEIGFGGGEHMTAQAARHEDVTILGCEPFVNGVASALRHIEEGGLKNIRLLPNDARPLLDKLPDASLSRIFILFADPWPKTRQQKRRFIQPETIQAFARVLKPGAKLRFATDWANYADWTLERCLANPDFEWQADRQADWTLPPSDHFTTRYEMKALGDCKPVFLDFKRK